jgi:hypothetical protein
MAVLASRLHIASGSEGKRLDHLQVRGIRV